jgi:hypothetical protein
LRVGLVKRSCAGGVWPGLFALALSGCLLGDSKLVLDAGAGTRPLRTGLAAGGAAALLPGLSGTLDREERSSWEIGPGGVSVRGTF